MVSAVAALWLCAAEPARAGDGADLGSLQAAIGPPNGSTGLCSFLGIGPASNYFGSGGSLTSDPCPQFPTITQAVLEIAGLTNSPLEAVRAATFAEIPVSAYIDAGNPSRPPGVNPINGFPVNPSVLSTLRPLAFFASSSGGSATPTQLYDPSANSFFYAAGGTAAGGAQPDTLLLFYDDPTRTTPFSPGQVAAKISLPLTVLNNDGVTERAVPAVLQINVPSTAAAPCSASTITGDFKGTGKPQSVSPAQVGVNCAVASAASPVSPSTHAIFEVAVPFLITAKSDPPYIDGTYSALASPFFGAPGFTPPGTSSSLLGAKGQAVGVAPSAAPLGAPASSTTPGTYSLCASFPTGSSGQTLVPAAAAFYAIAVDGEVLLSAPLAPSISIGCPAM
jgi:hypothetical protein